jgi:hypothetical protein
MGKPHCQVRLTALRICLRSRPIGRLLMTYVLVTWSSYQGRASALRAALLTQVQTLAGLHWLPRRHYRNSPVR